MANPDYEIIDNLPIRTKGSDRVWAEIVKVARANPGKWIRRNYQYKTRSSAASVGRRMELRNPGIVGASRERYVYLMFPGDADA